MEITISVDRNPEAWGADCDEVLAQRAAETLAQKLADDAQEEWPEAEVYFGTEFIASATETTVVEVTGISDWALVEDIRRRIEDWSEDQWEAALEIAVESTMA